MSRVGIKEVAEYASVSKGTVSRVLNNYPNSGISRATREQVIKIAKELGFAPHIGAAALSGKKTHIVGVLIINANNPFGGGLISSMEEVAQKEGYHVILCNTRGNVERVREEVRMLKQRGIEGLIIEHVGDSGYLKELVDDDYPFVILDRCPDLKSYDYVTNDDVAGGFLATQALIDSGRHKIANISGPLNMFAMLDRQEGYMQALTEAGMELRPEYMVHVGLPQSPECGREAAKRLFDLDVMPDGIFCSSDYLAMGVLNEATSRDIVIGKDVALIGYDNENFAPWVSVPLASICLDMEKVGYEAMSLLLKRIDDGVAEKNYRHIEIVPKLIPRASLGSVQANDCFRKLKKER